MSISRIRLLLPEREQGLSGIAVFVPTHLSAATQVRLRAGFAGSFVGRFLLSRHPPRCERNLLADILDDQMRVKSYAVLGGKLVSPGLKVLGLKPHHGRMRYEAGLLGKELRVRM